MYPGTRWLMGRAKLKALKETTLNTFFQLTSEFGITNQYNYNAQSGVIYWNNGSEIILKDLFLYPSDPNFDSLGSLEITGAFIDECNQVVKKAWQVVKSRMRYKLKEYNLMPKLLGSCNPAKNWVYSDFYKPFIDGELLEYRKFVQALPTDNPHLPQSYLDSLLQLDKASRMRLYYGNWEYDDNPALLMTLDNINNAFTNTFVEGGNKYISADIARFGKDNSIVVLWNGLIAEEIIKYKKKSTAEMADIIKDLAFKHKIPNTNISIDADGVGSGVVDQIKNAYNFVNNSRALNDENYANLKSQCYFKLAEKINKNEVYIKDDKFKEQIIEELSIVEQKDFDMDGKLAVIGKDKIKEILGRSPDISDALVMRMVFDLTPSNMMQGTMAQFLFG